MGTSNSGSSNSQSNNTVGGISAYTPDAPITAMNGAMIGYSGSSGPHNNVQPYQVLNWIISLFGVYPSPN
jgi:microcystin-dependent protein